VTPDPFGPFLVAQGVVVLDGGLATALEAAGHDLRTPLWSARLIVDEPDALRTAHRAYLEAGADCITTAGYQASIEGLLAAGFDRAAAEGVLGRAAQLAVEARDAFWTEPANREGRVRPLVAASAGPYGAYLADGSEYRGRYGVSRDVLRRFHAERLDVILGTASDVIAFETVPSGEEADVIAAVLAERPGARAWVSFSCRDSESLRDGTPVAEAASRCASVDGVVAVGVNCTAPRHVLGLVERIRAVTDGPIIAYPNSGESWSAEARVWTGSSDSWLDDVGSWVDAGARIVGGCCRIGPEVIRELRSRLVGPSAQT
jgi:homocysteine S-methyltransferase